MTRDEHREAYSEHLQNANELRVRIDLGLLDGVSEEKHRELTTTYHDELTAAAAHLALGMLLAEVEHD